MKKILLIVICSLLFPGSQHLCAQKQRAEAAYKVIERVSGQSGLPVKFSLKPNKEKGEGSTYFQYKASMILSKVIVQVYIVGQEVMFDSRKSWKIFL